MLENMIEADGRGLMKYAFEEEISQNDLDQQKLHELYRDLIIPRVSPYLLTAKTESQDTSVQGVAEFLVRFQDGRTLPFAASVYPTDRGVRGSVLEPLFLVWIIEFFQNKDIKFDLLSRNTAILVGLRRDKATLRQIGITKISSLDVSTGQVNMINIDELENRYAAWVASPSSGNSGP